jgi:hypothetical protein
MAKKKAKKAKKPKKKATARKEVSPRARYRAAQPPAAETTPDTATGPGAVTG